MGSAAAALRDFDYRRCARLAGVSRTQWAACVMLAFCASLADAGMLALLVPLGRILSGGENAFWQKAPWSLLGFHPASKNSSFLALGGLMFVLALVKNAFLHAMHMATGRVRNGAAERLANRAFERCLGFGKAWFDRNSPGQIAATIEYRNDVAIVFTGILKATWSLLLLVAYLAVMLLASWRLSLVALLLFPLVNLASRSILDRTAAAANRARDASLAIGKKMHEALAALPLYQASGEERQALSSFSADTARQREYAMRTWGLQGIGSRIQELTALAALLLMLALALNMGGVGSSQPAVLLVFFFIARLSLPVLAAFPETILDIAERLPRCREFMAVFGDDNKFRVPGGSREFDDLRQEVRFRKVTFAYPGAPPALSAVDFAIPKGELTALVGPSGAGKSTVVNLLARFYEFEQGEILIDGTDIREFSISSLRRALAIVSQDVMLLSDSLRANLVFGVDRPVDPDELESVIAEACLSDVIAMLPNGLDSQVGERGALLSGGQRQRVAVARALLRRPALLLLDEATSGLDAITEELVRQAIGNAVRRSTTLVIAHRFATIERAGHVIVLDGGRVAEQGPLRDLLAAGGLFRRMWDRQQFGD